MAHGPLDILKTKTALELTQSTSQERNSWGVGRWDTLKFTSVGQISITGWAESAGKSKYKS